MRKRTSKKIINLIREKSGLSRSGFYDRIKKIREEYGGTISIADGANLLASKYGVDLIKILSQDEIDRVRELQNMKPQLIYQKPRQIVPKKITLKFGSFKIKDPLLSGKILNEAQRMAEVYSRLYVLENSMRNVVSIVLNRRYGKDWWKRKVSIKIKREVQLRMEEEKENAWHGSRRGTHSIFYTDVEDLKKIINNNWKDFKGIFPTQSWITRFVDTLNLSRRIVAHNNPLTERNIKRLKMDFEDWMIQIREKKKQIIGR